MKKTLLSLVVVIMLSGLGSFKAQAQDGLFGDARTTEYNHFSLGIQPIIYTQPGSDFMMLFRGGYGVKPELSFHGKVGVFREDIYIGGHMKYRLLSELEYPITMSVIGGAYMLQDIGFKFSGVVSKNFGDFSLYTGLSVEPIFSVPANVPIVYPVGVDIPVTTQTSFIFEANLAVNEEAMPYQALNFGLHFRL